MTLFGELVIVPDESILDVVGFRWISLDLPPKRSSTGELLLRPVREPVGDGAEVHVEAPLLGRRLQLLRWLQLLRLALGKLPRRAGQRVRSKRGGWSG